MLTQAWLPDLACPECSNSVAGAAGQFVCASCARRFAVEDGILRFLTPERAAAAAAFMRQYRAVRAHEGYRAYSPEEYRRLPEAGPGSPHRDEWALRQESFHHLQSVLTRESLRILDLGAGNGWLSNRLALAGHGVVALDRLDDPDDGLGACRHYATPFACVQADFDALPFESAQFDVVVFNGSLHYSKGVPATLAGARRMLTPGGLLAVMDSPMFHREEHGQAMVADTLRRFATAYGLTPVIRSSGFLTFSALSCTLDELGLRARFVPSRGPLAWRTRRALARFRLRRAPAAFGTWIAQDAPAGQRGTR